MRDDVAEAFQRRLGRRGWDRHRRAVQAFWRRVGNRIRTRRLVPSRTRVYQDGLPVCGREREMVHELAAQGSQNHQIVKRLLDAGAEIVGTEDPALLLEEYERLKRQLSSMNRPRDASGADSDGATEPSDRAALAASLEPRDRFIAQRIDDTLRTGEVGLLFIGLMHDVVRHLPSDVEIEYLFEPAEVLRLTTP